MAPNSDSTFQTQAIQDITKSTSKAEGAEKQAEGKKIIEQLTTLKDEVVNDAKLTYAALIPTIA